MTVTYKDSKYLGVRVPVLHKVVYARTVDHVDAYYQRSYLDHLVDQWLDANCKGKYYHSPGHLKVKFIEFEDSEDAFLFALRWSNSGLYEHT